MTTEISSQEHLQSDVLNPIDMPQQPASDRVQDAHSQIADLWLRSPALAFLDWKHGQRVNRKEFAPHSVEQYESMFKAYLRWLESKGIEFHLAKPEHLDLFLMSKNGREGKPAAPTTRRRYLHLLNNVYEHVRLLELRKDNPAEPLIDLTKHQDFEKPLSTVLAFDMAERYIQWTLDQPDGTWCQLRDKALRLIFLCSGVTVGELQRLKPEQCITDSGFTGLEIGAHGFVRPRLAPVSAAGAPLLLRWKDELGKIAPASQHLFPARFYANGHDRPDATAVASDETYRIVQEGMIAIGFESTHQGPQTLRNTFIARQIREGKPVDRIMAWCGLNTSESVNKIAKLVPVRNDGVHPV